MKKEFENKKILILSGCLALQARKGTINHEDLFHEQIRKKALQKLNEQLIFNILRYNDFNSCFKNLQNIYEENPSDLIIFQVRSHYYLEYINPLHPKKMKSFLNGNIDSVQKDFNKTKLDNSAFNPLENKNANKIIPASNKSMLSAIYEMIFFPAGFMLGSIFGQTKIGQKKYKNLVSDVIKFAKEKNIQVVFIGMSSRPGFFIENLYTKKVNKLMEKFINDHHYTYIDIFGKYTVEKEYKFVKNVKGKNNKLSLSKIGHYEIANKLYAPIVNILFSNR